MNLDFGDVAAAAFDATVKAGPPFTEQDADVQQHYIDFAVEVAAYLSGRTGSEAYTAEDGLVRDEPLSRLNTQQGEEKL